MLHICWNWISEMIWNDVLEDITGIGIFKQLPLLLEYVVEVHTLDAAFG